MQHPGERESPSSFRLPAADVIAHQVEHWSHLCLGQLVDLVVQLLAPRAKPMKG